MQKNQAIALTALDIKGISRSFAVDATLVTCGTLLIALLAQVSLPLPFTPVPITGQTLGVMLSGAALGSRRGLASVLLYLVVGALGLPFFAGGSSGYQLFFGATGGYLVGFLLAGYVSGLLAERGQERSVRRALPGFLLAQACIYLVGIPWLGFVTGFENIWMKGLIPFLPGLVVKSALAGVLLPAAWKQVRTLES